MHRYNSLPLKNIDHTLPNRFLLILNLSMCHGCICPISDLGFVKVVFKS